MGVLENLIGTLQKRGDLSYGEALSVTELYIHNEVVVIDFDSQIWESENLAYFDRDSIRYFLEECCNG